MDNTKAATLISICFEARTKAHIAHLQSTSYAEHIALNVFYDSIIVLIDAYAESFQGRYGILSTYPTPTSSLSGLAMIKSLRKWIDENRKYCGDSSELQNEIDAIQTLCNSTIYKLENLK